MGTRDVMVGARTEHKEDFVVGGFGLGVQEHYNYSSSSSSPFSCYVCDGGSTTSAPTANDGPMFCASTSNQALASGLGDMYCNGGCGASAADPSFTLSSSGGTGMYMSEKVDALSAAQWQELERQTTIYKYMMASAPVPAELLIPFSRNTTVSNPNAKGSSLKLGISSSTSNNRDPEPWRCRRTDGKKWRCSRDVVPDQRYCERHSHKSRPRSRKPVELPPHIVNRATTKATATITKNASNLFASHATRTHLQKPHFYGQTETQFPGFSSAAPASSSYDHHRELRWFIREDDASNPDLRQMIEPNIGSSGERSKFGFDYSESFTRKDNSFSLEGFLSLNQPQTLETRRFIDAWSKSKPDANEIEAIANANCSLTLSVTGNEETENLNSQVITKHPWLSHEGSWMSSTPGGPLAEALCLGIPNNPNGSSSSGRSISNTTTSSCSRSSS